MVSYCMQVWNISVCFQDVIVPTTTLTAIMQTQANRPECYLTLHIHLIQLYGNVMPILGTTHAYIQKN